jgi:hypothetical protein
MGKRRSGRALLSWLRVTFYKIFKPDLWAQLWSQKVDWVPRIRLISLQPSYASS